MLLFFFFCGLTVFAPLVEANVEIDYSETVA